MVQAQMEYIRVFNSLEFELNLNRIPSNLVRSSNTNLLKRPMHYKYVGARQNPMITIASNHMASMITDHVAAP